MSYLVADPVTRLAVIIPLYISPSALNPRLNYFRMVLNEVLEQAQDIDQVIVVDDGSYIDVQKYLHSLTVPVTVQYRQTYFSPIAPWRLASSRNLGVQLAVGADAYIFLDADCLPAEGWLDAYRAAVDEYIATAAPYPGLVLFGRTDHVSQNGGVVSDPRVPDLDGSQPRREACLLERGGGGNMLVTRDIFEDLGGFDEEYDGGFGYEETDFAVRAYHAGAEVLYYPRAAVKHLYHPREREHFLNLDRNRRLFQARTRLFAGVRK